MGLQINSKTSNQDTDLRDVIQSMVLTAVSLNEIDGGQGWDGWLLSINIKKYKSEVPEKVKTVIERDPKYTCGRVISSVLVSMCCKSHASYQKGCLECMCLLLFTAIPQIKPVSKNSIFNVPHT